MTKRRRSVLGDIAPPRDSMAPSEKCSVELRGAFDALLAAAREAQKGRPAIHGLD